ncbi:hypothetical protein QBC37DRAFT_447174 [Rhypophila decipiens]|uniref:Uncharacterized protein n=1 Tax=Rhypophila decipiens TaxID=261697 RepID=A0AAN6Y7Q2_9PEZI|nr:hypothetical protein QBC37DRAFT_447174 [Rhypophila decipiens]
MANQQGDRFRIIQFANKEDRDNSKALVHSHASRITHARRRRARVIAYQAARDTGSIQNEVPQKAGEEFQQAVGGPSRIGLGHTDPFGSFARHLTVQEHLLFDHCKRCRYLKSRGTVFADNMTSDWVRLALNDTQCLNALFLNAVRHLSVNHQQASQQQRFSDLAIRYKLLSFRAVSDAITKPAPPPDSAPWFHDVVFLEILSLAFDELLLGNPTMTRSHVQGAMKMVELNGGWNTLGLDGFMEIILLRYAERAGLVHGVLEVPIRAQNPQEGGETKN